MDKPLIMLHEFSNLVSSVLLDYTSVCTGPSAIVAEIEELPQPTTTELAKRHIDRNKTVVSPRV